MLTSYVWMWKVRGGQERHDRVNSITTPTQPAVIWSFISTTHQYTPTQRGQSNVLTSQPNIIRFASREHVEHKWKWSSFDYFNTINLHSRDVEMQREFDRMRPLKAWSFICGWSKAPHPSRSGFGSNPSQANSQISSWEHFSWANRIVRDQNKGNFSHIMNMLEHSIATMLDIQSCPNSKMQS